MTLFDLADRYILQYLIFLLGAQYDLSPYEEALTKVSNYSNYTTALRKLNIPFAVDNESPLSVAFEVSSDTDDTKCIDIQYRKNRVGKYELYAIQIYYGTLDEYINMCVEAFKYSKTGHLEVFGRN